MFILTWPPISPKVPPIRIKARREGIDVLQRQLVSNFVVTKYIASSYTLTVLQHGVTVVYNNICSKYWLDILHRRVTHI